MFFFFDRQQKEYVYFATTNQSRNFCRKGFLWAFGSLHEVFASALCRFSRSAASSKQFIKALEAKLLHHLRLSSKWDKAMEPTAKQLLLDT